MGVDSLPQGRRQPFYHVLVDETDRPRRGQTLSSTCVGQLVHFLIAAMTPTWKCLNVRAVMQRGFSVSLDALSQGDIVMLQVCGSREYRGVVA